MEQKVKSLNNKLKAFCSEKLIDFIANENIDECCLGMKTSMFARNLINYAKSQLKAY